MVRTILQETGEISVVGIIVEIWGKQEGLSVWSLYAEKMEMMK